MEEKQAYQEMEEVLLIASQSKKERTTNGGSINMLSTQSAIYTENLPKINGAQNKTAQSFNKQANKSKSQGRNTANYNTANNLRNTKLSNQALSIDHNKKPRNILAQKSVNQGETFSDKFINIEQITQN